MKILIEFLRDSIEWTKLEVKKVGGTGLWLAIVKHIVLNLNGNIKVHSELNKGSKFIIEFPKTIKMTPNND